jgi:DNA-binding NtrC family response regulator
MSNSAKLERLLKMASESDATVLIRGATGTGKTTLARQIHDRSSRKHGPFVAINLATLHEGVLESELFGHEKGAFTGAEQKRAGKLELAQGGTVFLDEISELSPRLQARLLEFLQFRRLSPVGSNREIQLNVRIITATHRNLEQAVAQGGFREDLLHRIRVISIPLRSLQERAEELDALVHECLDWFASQANRTVLRISPSVAEKFERYSWPGNLRELRNVLEFAVLSSSGPEITHEDLPEWFLSALEPAEIRLEASLDSLEVAETQISSDYQNTINGFESEYLRRALGRNGGRVNRTARQIGLNKTTLLRRIKTYGLSAP